MAIIEQVITDEYALYNGDSCEVLLSLPDESVHLSVYSPPFAADGGGCLYHYSSSARDLSNCRTHAEFFEHYEFVVREVHRLTMPGRISAVHCMDIPNRNGRGLADFPGEIIRLHERVGWCFIARHFVWKEPLGVRNRTMARGLAHRQVVEDSSLCDVASADCLLLFRKQGENPVQVEHPNGLLTYSGSREMPSDIKHLKGHSGLQRENRYSHWIWRQYASAFWDDIRISRVLPFKMGKEDKDDRHMHPLQLDVIDRVLALRSNAGETVLTPFMGVGSEAYAAVAAGRKAVGVELKPSYFAQAKRNVASALERRPADLDLFELVT